MLLQPPGKSSMLWLAFSQNYWWFCRPGPFQQDLLKSSGDFQRDNTKIVTSAGVREHGMGAICNGLALDGLNPMVPRSCALRTICEQRFGSQSIRSRCDLYHDPLMQGEEPHHQPVEHLAALRVIPDLLVIRPADGNETSGAYK